MVGMHSNVAIANHSSKDIAMLVRAFLKVLFLLKVFMANNTNTNMPPTGSTITSPQPPAAKIQKVIAVEEVKETVTSTIEEVLKKFTTS